MRGRRRRRLRCPAKPASIRTCSSRGGDLDLVQDWALHGELTDHRGRCRRRAGRNRARTHRRRIRRADAATYASRSRRWVRSALLRPRRQAARDPLRRRHDLDARDGDGTARRASKGPTSTTSSPDHERGRPVVRAAAATTRSPVSRETTRSTAARAPIGSRAARATIATSSTMLRTSSSELADRRRGHRRKR